MTRSREAPRREEELVRFARHVAGYGGDAESEEDSGSVGPSERHVGGLLALGTPVRAAIEAIAKHPVLDALWGIHVNHGIQQGTSVNETFHSILRGRIDLRVPRSLHIAQAVLDELAFEHNTGLKADEGSVAESMRRSCAVKMTRAQAFTMFEDVEPISLTIDELRARGFKIAGARVWTREEDEKLMTALVDATVRHNFAQVSSSVLGEVVTRLNGIRTLAECERRIRLLRKRLNLTVPHDSDSVTPEARAIFSARHMIAKAAKERNNVIDNINRVDDPVLTVPWQQVRGQPQSVCTAADVQSILGNFPGSPNFVDAAMVLIQDRHRRLRNTLPQLYTSSVLFLPSTAAVTDGGGLLFDGPAHEKKVLNKWGAGMATVADADAIIWPRRVGERWFLTCYDKAHKQAVVIPCEGPMASAPADLLGLVGNFIAALPGGLEGWNIDEVKWGVDDPERTGGPTAVVLADAAGLVVGCKGKFDASAAKLVLEETRGGCVRAALGNAVANKRYLAHLETTRMAGGRTRRVEDV